MIICGEKIKEAYEYIHNDKLKKAKELLISIYNELVKKNYREDWDLKSCLLNTVLWILEILMKEKNFNDSLKYCELWNEITDYKDFNLLFNLGVIYRNIWYEEKSKDILELAKQINPNNQNLLRFLSEVNWIVNEKNKSINQSFLNKVNNMIKNIQIYK